MPLKWYSKTVVRIDKGVKLTNRDSSIPFHIAFKIVWSRGSVGEFVKFCNVNGEAFVFLEPADDVCDAARSRCCWCCTFFTISVKGSLSAMYPIDPSKETLEPNIDGWPEKPIKPEYGSPFLWVFTDNAGRAEDRE